MLSEKILNEAPVPALALSSLAPPTEKTPDDPPGEFKGVVSSATAKLAAKKLNPEEIEAARQAAETTVRQALHSDHGLPPADVERAYPDSCNVVVEGLPLVGTKQQRCCKAPTPSRDGGSQGVPLVPPLQLPGGKGRKLDASEERRGDELPAVLRPQRTGEVGGQQVSCFPAFIIAGTQKSGTTALAGEGRGGGVCGVAVYGFCGLNLRAEVFWLVCFGIKRRRRDDVLGDRRGVRGDSGFDTFRACLSAGSVLALLSVGMAC